MKENQKLKEEIISTKPFPCSQKIFVKGKLHEIEVAMREIETDDIADNGIKKEKIKITVYDTSGPFTDPSKKIEVVNGIEPIRLKWITERNDVEELNFSSSEYT